jgi:hypothetical protein
MCGAITPLPQYAFMAWCLDNPMVTDSYWAMVAQLVKKFDFSCQWNLNCHQLAKKLAVGPYPEFFKSSRHLIPYFSKEHFNIILPWIPTLSKWFLPCSLSEQYLKLTMKPNCWHFWPLLYVTRIRPSGLFRIRIILWNYELFGIFW